MSKSRITDKPVDSDAWAAFQAETGAFYSEIAEAIERPWAEWTAETDAIYTEIAANIAAPSNRFRAAIDAAYSDPGESPDEAPLTSEKPERK